MYIQLLAKILLEVTVAGICKSTAVQTFSMDSKRVHVNPNFGQLVLTFLLHRK